MLIVSLGAMPMRLSKTRDRLAPRVRAGAVEGIMNEKWDAPCYFAFLRHFCRNSIANCLSHLGCAMTQPGRITASCVEMSKSAITLHGRPGECGHIQQAARGDGRRHDMRAVGHAHQYWPDFQT